MKAVFLKAAEEAYDDERRDKILSTLLRFSLSEREMGWCLTGIGDVIDCFERLDKEKPYDSELSPHQTVRGGVRPPWPETLPEPCSKPSRP